MIGEFIAGCQVEFKLDARLLADLPLQVKTPKTGGMSFTYTIDIPILISP